MPGPIDAIKVGFGVDLSRLDSDLAQAKRQVDAKLPRERQIHVDVILRPARGGVEKLQTDIQKALTRPIDVEPRLRINPNSQSLRDFRRDVEQQFRRGGNINAIHVPIKPVFRAQDFRREIIQTLGGYVTVPIKGEWQGWANGRGPQGPSGPGGGGAAPSPRAPSGAPSGPAAPAQAARSRPQRAQAPASTVTRRAPNYMGGGVEVSSADRYEASPEYQRAVRQYESQRASGTGLYGGVRQPGPGGRPPVGPAAPRDYVTIGNVRQGAPIQELTDPEERAAYQRQLRARPTSPRGQFVQPEERYDTVVNGRRVSRIRPGASPARQKAAEAQRAAERQARTAQLLQSPQFLAARDLASRGFHGDPALADLAGALDTLGDPELGGTFDEFMAAAELRRESLADVRGSSQGKRGKRVRRQIGIARGYKKGDFDAVDPTLLLVDSALSALREAQNVALDPNYVVRKGDNTLRGRGGRVGRVGGRNAGRLASETVELAAQKRQPRYKPPVIREPGEGEVFGFDDVRDALAAPGGQGLYRSEFSTNRQRGQIEARFLTGEGQADYSHFNLARGGLTAGQRLQRLAQRRGNFGFPSFSQRPPLFFAEGGYLRGMYGRPIGQKFAEGEYGRSAASENSYEWQKMRRAQLARQPYCAHCGIGRAEARARGIPLTADAITSEAHGGSHWDEGNLQTLCRNCNSRKSGFSGNPEMTWTSARPNLLRNANYAGLSSNEFLPGGPFFGSQSFLDIAQRVRQMRKQHRAEGGTLRSTGLLARLAQAGHEPAITMVGERGPELIVQDRNTGEAEVVPTHRVPEWLRRAQEGKGVAKDLTGRAEGGPLRFRSGGRYVSQGAASINAINAGLASAIGPVQRVFVVNWPASITRPTFAGQPAQAAPRAQAQAASPGPGQQQAPPRQPGQQGPPGAPTPGTGPRVRGLGADPLTRVRAQRRAYESTEALEDILGTARGNITESLQQTPVRALSVAFGQIAQTAIGGRGDILRRAQVAQRTLRVAERERGRLAALQQQRAELIEENRNIRAGRTDIAVGERPEALAQNRRRLGLLRPAIGEQRAIATERAQEATTASQGILSRGQQFRSQAVGLGGIIAGTAAFSAAITATSFAAQAAGQALGPVVDETNSWSRALDQASGSIRDAVGQIRTADAARQAQAQLGLQAGLGARGADQLLGGLTARGVQQAAAQIQQQAVAATRGAAGALGRRNEALFSGTGGLFGGSLFAEQLGGQQGLLEGVVKQLQATQINGPVLNRARGPFGLEFGPVRAEDPNNPFQQIGAAANRFITGTSDQAASQQAADLAPQLDELRKATIADLNDALDRAAQAGGRTASQFEVLDKATEDQKNAMIESAKAVSAEAETRARDLAAQGVAFTARGGGALRGRDFETAANQFAQGRVIADPQLLLRATERQRRAQLFSTRAQGEFARQDIAGNAFLENLANPQSRFGTTFSTAGLRGSEGQKTLENIERYSRLSSDAQMAYLKLVQQGQAQAFGVVGQIDFPGGRPGGTGGPGRGGASPSQVRFGQLTSQIGQIGGQIRDITDSINIRQVNYEVAQYNEQIRITQRSLTDAKDLWAAINGAQIKSVGGLQGQNILLDRQNQLLARRQQRLGFKSEDLGFRQTELQFQAQQLQFELSQRQINFNKAIAGFVAPGTTPEERAARIEEAKIEADYAQKQLNLQEEIAKAAREQLAIAKEQAAINRQIFANQNQQQDNNFAIQVEEARRNVGDLQKQLDLAFQGRAITIDSAAAQKAIEDLQKQLNPIQQEAEQLLEEGRDIRTQVLSDVTNLMAETGKGFSELVGDVQNAWQRAAQSYISDFLIPVEQQIQSIFGGGGTTGGGGTGGGKAGSKLLAPGGIETVSQPTRYIAGEAGTESVIVLRNPKQGMTALGSGGGTGGGVNFYGGINITLTGGTGSSDEEQVADRLARKVEERINRKLSMIAG